MSTLHSSTRGNPTRLPKPKPLTTIDIFTVQQDRVDDLIDYWNDIVSEIPQFDNVNSINLYQNLSHNKTNWILQIEWKSEQDLKEALSHQNFGKFQEFLNHLNQWNIAISPEQKKYVPQIYRKFPGINFDQAISTPKPSWRISTNFIIIITFVFGIGVALLILILR
jgi:quinol monooxygenase YgiN